MQLCILCCCNFLKEVKAAVETENADDIVVSPFPAQCGRPPVSWSDLRPLIPADCKHVVVLGTVCLKDLREPPPNFPGTRVVQMTQCFHLVASENLVTDAITSGAYVITPGWLSDWRGQLKALGFVPEKVSEFFQDFCKELVLLDTGIEPDTSTQISELQAAVKLPVRCISVGLDHTRLLLTKLILEWRLEQTNKAAQEKNRRQVVELADHMTAIDMLERLTKAQHEAETIASIEKLFNMLFAPAALHYLRVENRVPVADKPIPDEMLKLMHNLRDDYTWTPDGNGFLLRIRRGKDVLGLAAIDRLSFPQYRQRYLNMALACTGFCGLAIENARNRRRLLETEKLASLANMVAGVAHEINTPLGISLTAASMLEKASGNLADKFSNRSLTQSDLLNYLKRTQEGMTLISNNLERIGKLSDVFRRVAMNGCPSEKRLFSLNDCVDKVIRSMGNLLSSSHITVKVECDPALEVNGIPDDWSTIFINLFDNSIKHGFKDRKLGVINVSIVSTEKLLYIEYRDDGIGMAPEVQSQIFEPFFTTNMQGGMGLGMHLIYNLITHRMNGIIQLISKPDQGVYYQIEVPQ